MTFWKTMVVDVVFRLAWHLSFMIISRLTGNVEEVGRDCNSDKIYPEFEKGCDSDFHRPDKDERSRNYGTDSHGLTLKYLRRDHGNEILGEDDKD